MMYGVNDVFDYESDRKNPRKGGIEGAVLARSHHKLTLWAVAVTNIPFLAFLWMQGGLAANIVLCLVVFQVLAYSLPILRFKERPFVDSFTSACHFVGPLLYALVLTGWHQHYLAVILAFLLWGVASHAFGAVQDMQADRQAGIGSIATVIGARKTVRFSSLAYACASLVLFTQGVPAIICGLINLMYIANIAPFWNISEQEPQTAHQGWKRFLWLNQIAGFTVTLLLIIRGM